MISKLGEKNQRKGHRQKRQQRSTHIQPLDEKSQQIQRTEFPTGALVGAGPQTSPTAKHKEANEPLTSHVKPMTEQIKYYVSMESLKTVTGS